jgi:cytochrome c nitrite reductase small subunit
VLLRNTIRAVVASFGVAFGVAAGVGGYTFVYAKGGSYMTNDPRACANCHIMQEQYDGWLKSSHRNVAVCNDCHTPHDFIGKYTTKALNGYHHSLAFTTGEFHEPIQIKARNKAITEAACRSCHQEITQAIDPVHRPDEEMSCIRCHSSVGHMH